MKRWIPVIAAVGIVAGLALAQRLTADQGRPGKEGPWPVTGTSASGAVFVTPSEYTETAFGEFRVASDYRLEDLINTYDLDPFYLGTAFDGGATVAHLPNESTLLLSAPTDGGWARLRTHTEYKYQAGSGQRILQTVAIPTAPAQAGETYRWGNFDSNDGLFWEYSTSGLNLVVRSSTDGGVFTETQFAADAGPTWAPGNGSIYELNFSWLGVGTVHGFINGTLVAEHHFYNTLGGVYMKTAVLPLSWEVQNSGARTATMKTICGTVHSEGGETPGGPSFAVARPADLAVSSGTTVPIIALRPAMLFKAIKNRAQIIPHHIWCLSETKSARISIFVNPTTLTGGTFITAGSNSAAEYSADMTGYTGGTLVGSFSIAKDSFFLQDMDRIFGELTRKLRRRAFATSVYDGGYVTDTDTIVVVASNPGAGNSTVNCGIEFNEVR